MFKVIRRQWLLLTLPCLWLLAALAIGGSIQAWLVGTPTAVAVSRNADGVASDCIGTYHKPSIGSPVVVNSGEVICSNLISFGGPVVVRGEVKGDVVAFGADVVIGGKIDGNVSLYAGNITLQDNALINGDIHLCGGNWIHGEDTGLHGSMIDCTRGVNQILSGGGGPGFHFWSLVTWNLLGTLLVSLFPEHVTLVRTTARSKFRRSFVLGLLSVLLAPVVLAVLTALIIPIPLAIIVAIGLVAAWALGTVAIGWLLGDYIVRTVTPHHNHTRLIQVIVGLTALVLAGSLPYIGWLISIGAGLLGLGAVFLSRFGTRLYGSPKQPLL